jgi:hypothetical protein
MKTPVKFEDVQERVDSVKSYSRLKSNTKLERNRWLFPSTCDDEIPELRKLRGGP